MIFLICLVVFGGGALLFAKLFDDITKEENIKRNKF
jgi:hypothetical protein